MSPTVAYTLLSWPIRLHALSAARLCVGMFAAVCCGYASRRQLRPQLRLRLVRAWPQWALWAHAITVTCITLELLSDYISASKGVAPPVAARLFFWDIHAALTSLNWIIAQLPPRLAFFPEVMRTTAFGVAALRIAAAHGALTASYAAGVALECLCCVAATTVALGVCYAPMEGMSSLLCDLETCPRLLRRPRDWLDAWGATLRVRLFQGDSLLDATSAVVLGFYSVVQAFDLFVAQQRISLPLAACRLSQVLAVVLAANVAVKAYSSAQRTVETAGAEVQDKRRRLALMQLRGRLVQASSEAAILRLGAGALGELFPGATAHALGCFAVSSRGGAGDAQLSSLKVSASEPSQRAALQAALPAGGQRVPHAPALGPESSVLRCRQQPSLLLDSRDSPLGLAACPDWAAAREAGLCSGGAVTAALRAGPVAVGFLTLHFPPHAPRAPGIAALAELGDILGAALLVHRALVIDRANPAGPAATPRQPPQNTITGGLARRSSMLVAFPATQADAAALEALDESAAEDELLLCSWALDAWELSDEELHRLFQAHLHALGMLRRFRISPTSLHAFSSDVASRMQASNPFHNWRHVFMVFHTAWLFLFHDRDLREKLEELDVLALLLSAICHDLGHPGTTNAFQINSGSQLALLYNDRSVLENHHASSTFGCLERCMLLEAMEARDYASLRKTVVTAILATDMASHTGLHARVTARMQPADGVDGELEEQGCGFSLDSPEDRYLLVSYLLHCADLCCPLFPPQMSRRVSEALSREFEAQAAVERAAALPVSVPVADTIVGKAELEVGFINYVVRPLFDTLLLIAPVVGPHCLQLMDVNRAQWAQLILDGEQAAGAQRGFACQHKHSVR